MCRKPAQETKDDISRHRTIRSPDGMEPNGPALRAVG